MNPTSRRSFIARAAGAAVGPLAVKEQAASARPKPASRKTSEIELPTRYATARTLTEWAFRSGKAYADPFNDVSVDVVFRDAEGREQRVPAFWAGDQMWRVRYAPAQPGRYTYQTMASDPSNPDLHGLQGALEVSPYTGDNLLLKHGPLRTTADQRHLEHDDGTPFFWLGDTWWMGLCRRLRWPQDFQTLAADRVKKGFSVIQIVAGIYPDMPAFDPRGLNEAGHPWESEFAGINPHYFDMADLRIQYLVDRGLVPCVVGCWGYYLPMMGIAKIKQHWRYLVARWGALPVVWCLAGEGVMPYYLSAHREEEAALQKRSWTEVAKYVREMDPYRHPITIHPTERARDQVEDPDVLDFEMLQTGHSDRASIPNTVNQLTGGVAREPRMPVLVGEVCYEGILEASRQEVQRFMFWAAMLGGAAGHTYGANGVWQVNTSAQPYGPSPHGRSWGDMPWDVAYQLPGSEHLGLGKAFLSRYPWWRLEPHPEWVEPHWNKADYMLPYAAGIPRELRIVFIPSLWNPPKIAHLEHDVAYHALFFDPTSGKEHPLGRVAPDAQGFWQVPFPPTFADWVVVLEKQS